MSNRAVVAEPFVVASASSRLVSGVGRKNLIAIAVLAVAWLVLPLVVSGYWLQVSTGFLIYSVVALGLNLLIGRVGLVSLGQIALLGVGAWFALRLGYAFALPFPVTLLATGLLTAVIGVIVGLPALRLTGLHLALITLMAAAAITLVLQLINFPNGGGGLLGYNPNASSAAFLRPPAIAETRGAYFRYAALVVALMFVLAFLHVRGKAGRAWAAMRQSEAAATATGINVTLYKLWAFALAAFMTGVAGALLAASPGGITIYQFPAVNSVMLVAGVLISGAFTLWGALIAAVFTQIMPALMSQLNIPAELLNVLFAIGVIQTLLGAPGGVAQQMPKDLARLGRFLSRLFRRKAD